MSVFSSNFKYVEKYTVKSLRVDNLLYNRLQDLAHKKYDASINQLVNAAIDNLFDLKEIKLYISNKDIDYIERSYLIREGSLEKLNKLKQQTEMSIASLVNIAIYEPLKSEEQKIY